MGAVKIEYRYEPNALTDKCPNCGVSAPRVFNTVHNEGKHDPQGKHDVYICDECLVMWPTEWSEAYKVRVNGYH